MSVCVGMYVHKYVSTCLGMLIMLSRTLAGCLSFTCHDDRARFSTLEIGDELMQPVQSNS